MKVDQDISDSDDQNCKRKRPNLVKYNISLLSNEKNCNFENSQIPSKLLFELASLSSAKFKIELKAKFKSLVLPLDNNQDKEKDENLNYFTYLNQNFNKNKKNQPNKTNESGESNYIQLNCVLMNRKLALVPPIRILLEYNYPESNPFVDCEEMCDHEDDMLPGYSKKKKNTINIRLNFLKIKKITYQPNKKVVWEF
jgi:hypothetical protein